MFIQNKYKKWYDELIERRRIEILCKKEVYCEKHHIVPVSLGGSNLSSNLVNLTGREHFIAHLLLTKFTEGEAHRKMCYAVHRLVYSANFSLRTTSRQYESLRKKWSKLSSKYHPSKTTPDWCEKVSKSISDNWATDLERKEKFSTAMKQRVSDWKNNDPQYYSRQRKNAIKGAKAAKLVCAKSIEYKGTTYLGWTDLIENTGVTKHLYNKFYKNGIDPTFRIGKDGPMTEQEIVDIVNQFCYLNQEQYPNTRESMNNILTRMQNIGLITLKQKELIMKDQHLGKALEGGVR